MFFYYEIHVAFTNLIDMKLHILNFSINFFLFKILRVGGICCSINVLNIRSSYKKTNFNFDHLFYILVKSKRNICHL